MEEKIVVWKDEEVEVKQMVKKLDEETGMSNCIYHKTDDVDKEFSFGIARFNIANKSCHDFQHQAFIEMTTRRKEIKELYDKNFKDILYPVWILRDGKIGKYKPTTLIF